jgi:DNA-binding SARP family transcriptional activator/pimeloyl-ACP methyl ester carboxylesterase
VDFRILGPLEVRDGDRELRLGGGKQRALLALLLVNANRTVSIDRIVGDLWGGSAPETAPKMVQIYVSKLRKLLAPGTLHTRPPGYSLQLEPDELDLHRFERDVAEARAALDAGGAQQAADRLREALALWRGPALAEFASEPFAPPEGARLEELRIAALESRLDADLALGRHRAVVSELAALTGRHPLRERLRSQHMLALYRSGRHAEALASYQTFRRKLADELGIEPSASLREFERQMLQQDPSLELTAQVEIAAAAASTAAETASRAAVGDIAYARSGEIRIAYQVVGDGPVDLVLVHGWVCTFQPGWEYPKLAAFYRQLASMGRLILFDKRGTGLSDRVSPEHLPDLETRMDDVRAVLDAVGSERAVLLGLSEGGAMSTLFAATHPERTAALVLIGTFPREMQAPDYPWGVSEENLHRRLRLLEEEDWASAATRDWLGRVAPDIPRDPEALRWYTSYVQRGASPGAARALRLMNTEIDIRDLLATISVPTLVLHRAGETWRGGSRYMGEHIPGARIVELPGDDHLPWEGDTESLLDEIERFLSDARHEVEPDRVLATLLVVDVVGSTANAAEVDDRVWNDRVLHFRRLVRAQLARFRGREVDTAGDGLLATFDGPARAIRCASAIVTSVRDLGLETRVGVHTGEVEQTGTGVHGVAVDIGARIAAAARPGEVLVSNTVRDIVAGSGIAFEERGEQKLDGAPGTWRLFAACA